MARWRSDCILREMRDNEMMIMCIITKKKGGMVGDGDSRRPGVVTQPTHFSNFEPRKHSLKSLSHFRNLSLLLFKNAPNPDPGPE